MPFLLLPRSSACVCSEVVRVCAQVLSCVWLFVTPWTVPCQSLGFSRQEYWNGLPFPSSGDLPNPGIESRSAALQSDSSPSEPPGMAHKIQENGSFRKEQASDRDLLLCCREKTRNSFKICL